MAGGNGKSRSIAAGTANLQRWRAAHPEGGALRHGAYSQQVRQRYSDARTTEGRALRAVMDELRKDLGTVSVGQSLILGRVREKLIVLMQIGAYVDKQPSAITAKGELLPCLGRGYTAFSEALRRDVELLYVMAKRTPSKVPSLSEYLASKRR
jgi:hypothetical protein